MGIFIHEKWINERLGKIREAEVVYGGVLCNFPLNHFCETYCGCFFDGSGSSKALKDEDSLGGPCI